MTVEVFLDTNILVYAATGTQKEKDKREKAFELIEAGGFGVSGQVLQEFYVVVTRKVSRPLSPVLAFGWIEQLDIWPCVPVDAHLVKAGIEMSERYKISYWDGAIVAAAVELGVRRLYSEDLNHGQSYGSVQIINPFMC